MTRPLPSSELQLTRAQVRELVDCPWCLQPAGEPCDHFYGESDRLRKAREAGSMHRGRWNRARALVRARRLERP